jgi:hypothetical protein
MALALSLFGGQSKNIGDKHRICGDINILSLLVGSSWGRKESVFEVHREDCWYVLSLCSLFLLFSAYQCAQDKGASAVGLTAAVRIDPVTRERVLEVYLNLLSLFPCRVTNFVRENGEILEIRPDTGIETGPELFFFSCPK